MTFLDDVRADRQPLAHVLKKHRGIRKIVEEFYPDRAHFIYELLQNAVDATGPEGIGATKASFSLGENSVSFEHNGGPFTKDDVWGITDIGEGTKAGEKDKLGCYGVGFKAVFAFTETPHIWSPTFSFKISDLVLPEAIAARPELGEQTRFEFPFNSPKKNAHDAYAEVEAGLNELAETTLLFLSHLKSIRWQIGEQGIGEVLRIQHSENHIEVMKRVAGKRTERSHFLRFSEPVKGLEKQCVSVAFALDCLPNVTAFDPEKALAKQLKIVPANPGRVAVFFPAEKETSGLRFHLHAPFVPELSRASIKETPANDPLFKQLADLAAASLHRIRELNLLSADFLGVLPNPQDSTPLRYRAIRAAIVDAMNDQSLTPTHSKSHAPAKRLLQAKATLKALLSPEDVEFLVDYEDEPPEWAVGASQKNSDADRFLSGLQIREWDVGQFVDRLVEKASVSYWRTPDNAFTEWLAGKPLEWHQHMYSLLYKELSADDRLYRLHNLQLVRLSDGTYSVGSKCYFPTDDVEHDETFPRVAKAIYSSGKSKTQQTEAKKLLEAIDVREVGEGDEVQAILQERYTAEVDVPDEGTLRKDLKRFVAFVEKEPDKATVFGAFYILERADEKWARPSETYLDSPFLETGLSAYYQTLGEDTPLVALSKRYETTGIAAARLRKFFEVIGVQASLTVKWRSTSAHPSSDALRADYQKSNVKLRKSKIDDDWVLPHLEDVLRKPSEALARLLWKTLRDVGPKALRACFRPNQQYETREEPSSLVLLLRSHEWIPQTNGHFVRPSQASRERLPHGFPFDAGSAWLNALRFGEEEETKAKDQKSKEAAARDLGFRDAGSLERARQFATLPLGEQERVLAECQRRQSQELPEHEPHDPERRAKRVRQQAADAPEWITEERTRSVPVGREAVKKQTEPYLREQYSIADGDMICQICKAPLPFKLDNGNFYFEKIPFLPGLKKAHYQNFLALCPNHAAMFEHANGSQEAMQDMFLAVEGNELKVVLAQTEMSIYFTKTHIADLNAVIEAEQTGTKPCP